LLRSFYEICPRRAWLLVVGLGPDLDKLALHARDVLALDDDEHAVCDPLFEQGRDLRPMGFVRGVEVQDASNCDPGPILSLGAFPPSAGGDRGLRLPKVCDCHAFKSVRPFPGDGDADIVLIVDMSAAAVAKPLGCEVEPFRS
jgi:hypothetical protein